jgi:hypothetical protein
MRESKEILTQRSLQLPAAQTAVRCTPLHLDICCPQRGCTLCAATGCFHLFVKVIDDRHASRDIYTRDVRVTNVFQRLHQSSERISMGRDEDCSTRAENGNDVVAPKRKQALLNILERLCLRLLDTNSEVSSLRFTLWLLSSWWCHFP